MSIYSKDYVAQTFREIKQRLTDHAEAVQATAHYLGLAAEDVRGVVGPELP